jgi:hypothetical protein
VLLSCCRTLGRGAQQAVLRAACAMVVGPATVKDAQPWPAAGSAGPTPPVLALLHIATMVLFREFPHLDVETGHATARSGVAADAVVSLGYVLELLGRLPSICHPANRLRLRRMFFFRCRSSHGRTNTRVLSLIAPV